MMPSKHRPTTTAVSGPLGFGLAVCAVMLVCGLHMEDTREAADAIPAHSGHRWRPQQTSGVHVPSGSARETLDELYMSGRGETEAFQAVLRRWSMADPVSAAAWAGQLSAATSRRMALRIVAIEWAGVDMQAATAWVREMPDPAETKELLRAVSAEAVRTDPVEALHLAVELSEGEDGDETIRRAAMEWASKDTAGAMEWAKTIPDQGLRHAVLAAELVAWAETAPETAAGHALETLPAGRLLDDTVVSIVQRWAQSDARAAAAWVERFPESSLRAAAIENLLSQWRQIDPVTARQWQAGNL
jgi:hypothetical protein